MPTNLITNGTFDIDVSGWTRGIHGLITWEAGRARVSKTSLSYPDGAYASFPTVPGRVYRATLDLSPVSGGAQVRVGNGTTPDAGILTAGPFTAAAAVDVTFTALGPASYLYIRLPDSATSVTLIDDVRVIWTAEPEPLPTPAPTNVQSWAMRASLTGRADRLVAVARAQRIKLES